VTPAVEEVLKAGLADTRVSAGAALAVARELEAAVALVTSVGGAPSRAFAVVEAGVTTVVEAIVVAVALVEATWAATLVAKEGLALTGDSTIASMTDPSALSTDASVARTVAAEGPSASAVGAEALDSRVVVDAVKGALTVTPTLVTPTVAAASAPALAPLALLVRVVRAGLGLVGDNVPLSGT